MHYLKQIKYIRCRIELKTAEMEWIQKMIETLSQLWQPYFKRYLTETDSLQQTLMMLSKQERELSQDIENLVSLRQEAQKWFDKLQHPMGGEIMVQRYLLGRSFEDIAKRLDGSAEWIKRIHDQSVKEFNLLYEAEKGDGFLCQENH